MLAAKAANLDEVWRGLDTVSRHGVPYALVAADPGKALATRLVAERALVPLGPDPLMVCSSKIHDADVNALTIRLLANSEWRTHAGLIHRSSGEADEPKWVAPFVQSWLRTDQARLYVGEVDSRPVTTALAFPLRDSVGIYNPETSTTGRQRMVYHGRPAPAAPPA